MRNFIQGLGIGLLVFSLFLLLWDYKGSPDTLVDTFDAFSAQAESKANFSDGYGYLSKEGLVGRRIVESEAGDQEKIPVDPGTAFPQFECRNLAKFLYRANLSVEGFFVAKDITIVYHNLRI
jgi:hypothetical protein